MPIAIPLPQPDKHGSSGNGATMTVDELKARILNGEIKREDLKPQQRDLYQEELKKARRY